MKSWAPSLLDGAGPVEAVLVQPDEFAAGAVLLGVLRRLVRRAGVVESGQTLFDFSHLKCHA